MTKTFQVQYLVNSVLESNLPFFQFHTQTNNTTTEFSWENTSPGPDFNSLSYTYNNSTTNLQTGEVNISAFIWDFAEDYNSADTTTEAGVINNWTRR